MGANSVLKLFKTSTRNCFTPYEICLLVEKSKRSIYKEIKSLLLHHYIDKIVMEIDGRPLILYKKDKNTKWGEKE